MIHSTHWLEAHQTGSTTEDEVRVISAHAAHCAECRLLLMSDEEIRRRLAVLRIDEPRIDVLRQVMRRIDEGID